tara:strand:- start:617 stop:1204 length:588 start_codon:yes stop_codon:yes gene_type:complete
MIDVRDLIYRNTSLINKDRCKYFIDFFEEHVDKALPESSTKYELDKNPENLQDNFLALNLSLYYKDPKFKEAADIAFSLIRVMVLNYAQYLKIKITPTITDRYMSSTDNIRIMRYKQGQEIKDHLDIGSENIRASCTLNLNENYEGGAFSFFSGKHLLDLKEGEGIVFPAEQIWVHGVRPVTKGTRYAINCFLRP